MSSDYRRHVRDVALEMIGYVECVDCGHTALDGKYVYRITPIFIDNNGNEVVGEEIILPDILITTEIDFKNSKWWEDN